MTDESSAETDSPVVLIVEDERNLADLYTTWLADEYGVRAAYNGEEALKAYNKAVDVVLLDRRMPGLSGDDVLDEIRGRPGECRVAMVTAVEPDFDILELGFDDYLTKPISKEDLYETVEGLLARATYDEELKEYYALVSKRAALKAEKSPEKLTDDDRYAELTARIDELEAQLDREVAELDTEDYVAVFRNLDENDS